MAEADRWLCPVCGGSSARDRFGRPTTAGQVGGTAFRPSAEHFGQASGRILTCLACGHGSLADNPSEASLYSAYEDSADPVSVREEDGQVETSLRALDQIHRFVAPQRAVDLGCWTGSFLVAARTRGWDVVGVEPSVWAADRARARGIPITGTDLFNHGLIPHSFELVVMCDVIEHLTNPRRALAAVWQLLSPGGAAYITVPNAGSRVARILGRRWWSVLPMHVQYFTPQTIRLALQSEQFEVRSLSSHAKSFSARYRPPPSPRRGGAGRRVWGGFFGVAHFIFPPPSVAGGGSPPPPNRREAPPPAVGGGKKNFVASTNPPTGARACPPPPRPGAPASTPPALQRVQKRPEHHQSVELRQPKKQRRKAPRFW